MTRKDPQIEEMRKSLIERDKPTAKKRPTTKGHPLKANVGVFKPYYGTKFFCGQTGAVFELKERDPGLGLNVLRVNRNSYRRLVTMDRERLQRGLEPTYLGDLYLSDAETILLLRGFPLPHLGLDLKLLSKENIRHAMAEHDSACDALLDEVYIRRQHRRTLYRLHWKNPNIQEKVKPIRVQNHEKFKTSADATIGIHQDIKEFKEALAKEGIERPEKFDPPSRKPRKPQSQKAGNQQESSPTSPQSEQM